MNPAPTGKVKATDLAPGHTVLLRQATNTTQWEPAPAPGTRAAVAAQIISGPEMKRRAVRGPSGRRGIRDECHFTAIAHTTGQHIEFWARPTTSLWLDTTPLLTTGSAA